MAISRNKKQPTAKKSRVKNATITNLADFDPETTIVIDGDAIFEDYPEITYLGNLQEIKGVGDFRNSQVQHLGNLQTIGGWADFENSKVQNLGKLRTIGGSAYFSDSQVQSLGNLQTIEGDADFQNSKIRNLGKLQTIGHTALFQDSQVQDLGNLQTIEGWAYFEGSQIQSLGNLQTIGGDADFRESQVQSLGNLQTIGGEADFRDSQIQSLGNLQTIGGDADFRESQVQDLGNLQTIEGFADFGSRTDLKAEWELRQKDDNYAEGGGVEIPKNKSLRHFILNEMSDGMIANRVPYSDYATIDKIRIQAVQILNRDGDREYSMQSVSDLIQEALLEYEENKNYAEGGGVRGGIRYVDGKQLEWVDIMSFDIADYGEKEAEKKAYDYIEKSITYWKGELNKSDFKVRKSRNGKDFEGSWVVMRQYPKYANGGGVDMYSKFDFNEKGNLSARINQKNYEIEYNDADGVYELFENGERVQSNKNVRTLMQFRKYQTDNYAEGGGIGDVYTLKDEDDTWYLTYIDSTHFFLSNTKEYKGSAYHIGQFRTRPFYNEVLSWLKSHKGQQSYAEGGGVGEFSSKEYDKPRGKTTYDVEVEKDDFDYGETIVETYDNYDEAISAYERSKYRFEITWRTYLETQKPPFVYERGIVLPDGTLAVKYRKGKDVKHDWNGNEIYAKGGGVRNFAVGQSVMIAENNDNVYYDDFRGKELVIYHKATNEKEHRGFDNSMEGQALYSFFLRETGEQVPFSCYDYELEQY